MRQPTMRRISGRHVAWRSGITREPGRPGVHWRPPVVLCLGVALMLSLGFGPMPVVHAAGCLVTNTTDSGAGSLRQAITDVNASNCTSPIAFAIGTGAQTINVPTSLPALTANVTIDGTTQPGYAGAPLITLQAVGTASILSVASGKTVGITALLMKDAVTAITNAGTVTVTQCTFTDNIADSGGAINNTGTLIVFNSTFQNNVAGSSGGAIATTGGNVTVQTSLFSGNGAGINGSAINATGGTVIVTGSTITGGPAGPVRGGGIYVSSRVTPVTPGILYVTNSTISGNTAIVGGGISLYQATGTIVNTTVSGNTANTGGADGGGLAVEASTLTIRNTIVANNTSVTSSGPDVSTHSSMITVAAEDHNVVGKTDGTSGVFVSPTDHTCTIASPLDPGLAALPLANNGGPTLTDALVAGSIAIDNGNDTLCNGNTGMATVGAKDQRGVQRPQGPHCDIGAFEYLALNLIGGNLPTSGGIATLTGTGFQPGIILTIGGQNAPVTAISSDGTGLTANVPVHAPGIVNATVSEPYGVSPAMANVTYVAFTPIITTISPTNGDVRGGTPVTLKGSYFAPDASVAVDGAPVMTFTVVNGTTITLTAPAHAAGAVNVSVTVQGLTATKTHGYTYGTVNMQPMPHATVPPLGMPLMAPPTHAAGSSVSGPPMPQPQPVRH